MNNYRPIILAIVGDSAAGKSTLTKGLVQILDADRVTVMCTDDYHKYERRERAKLGITPCTLIPIILMCLSSTSNASTEADICKSGVQVN